MEQTKASVIHTRIPESLDREIKRRADSLGLSVSNLVRNILQNTFGLVEGIVSDSASIARVASGGLGGTASGAGRSAERMGGEPATEPAVLGWQELVLAVNALCERCNAILPKGTPAAVGVTEAPGRRPFLCCACLAELTSSPGGDAERGAGGEPSSGPSRAAGGE